MTQAIASGRPVYELRSRQRGPSDLELEVWQVPSTATPELKEPRREARRDLLSEDALAMGLLFKLLAPMRNVAAIENCARCIDGMAREETAGWLGMAMHRKNPRRVLAALWLPLSAS